MAIVRKSSKSSDPKVVKLRRVLGQFRDVKEAASTATNALNRQKTVLKNEIFAFLDDDKSNRNSGIVIGDEVIAYRPNVSEEIDPRVWYDWFQRKKISANQFFGALNVSITEARKAVGEDQIGDISFKTLTKYPDLRTEAKPINAKEGDVIAFGGDKIPTKKEAKTEIVPDQPTAPIIKKRSRKLLIGRR